jgi:hypothetical protein
MHGLFEQARYLRFREPKNLAVHSRPVSPSILQAERAHEFGHIIDGVLAVDSIGIFGRIIVCLPLRIIRPASGIFDIVNVVAEPSEPSR